MRDAAEGEAALFIEDHGERDGLRAELHRGGAERIGGLQRMPALHAAMTLPALADRDTKFVDHGALDGQVFLVLRDDAAPPHGPAAVRTLRAAAARHAVQSIARRPGADAPSGHRRRPALRPGRSGCAFGRPRENGAACRFARRRAISSSSFSRSFSRRSRLRSFSDRSRSSRSRSICRA